jgi:hypothetical protein
MNQSDWQGPSALYGPGGYALPEVLAPFDATDVCPWLTPADGIVRQLFVGTMRGDRVHVNILGRQFADGTVKRFIQSDAGYLRHEFTSAEAREHARLLIAAADELDHLASAGTG